MNVMVRYFRSGKVVSMGKRFADILVKTKHVEVIDTSAKHRLFEDSILTKGNPKPTEKPAPKVKQSVKEKIESSGKPAPWGEVSLKSATKNELFKAKKSDSE